MGFAELAVVGFDEVEVSDDADFSAVADVESVVSRPVVATCQAAPNGLVCDRCKGPRWHSAPRPEPRPW